ncbi:MAG: hypothetical protein A4E35_01197 [Methanoregula sp. PtaU1.Bin051]|nr:MAG: hypothetical protein A4E35_01197 [Methanoregula sp. PtaU1.Bin051]
MIIYPMVISSAAVVITLIYASYLDIRDRRVPFIYWLPMLVIGVCCTGVMLWQSTGNAGLIIGYVSLVTSFLYADYLDNRGRTDSPSLTLYYRKDSVFYYLIFVLALPAVSWFLLTPAVKLQLVTTYALFAGTFLYVTWLECTGKFDPPDNMKRTLSGSRTIEAIGRWYFIPVILIYVISSIFLISNGVWDINGGILILLPAVFCGIFYTFGRMHLFGGADAWALIFISLCVPVFPIPPLLGVPPIGFLAFSALVNALLLNLAAPLGIFIINILHRNRAPLMFMFFGFPVKGDAIEKTWGFVMEEFEEKDGRVMRKFIGFWDAIRRMYSGTGRVYTKDLREQPKKYTRELAIYKKAGTVWISYAVPFIIPITAGFVTAVLFGDFLLAGMTMILRG